MGVSGDSSKKVLIVEDDFYIRDLYEMQAKRAGYIVVTASDGEEAITKAKAEKPHLILFDLMLPKMDGINAMKAIKSDSSLKEIPCLFISNYDDTNKRKEAMDAGAVGYLLKVENTPQTVIEEFKKYI